MSGHSKWAQIKRQKGAADIKKGAAFTKLANAVTVAAREGGGDPAMNFKLRLTIERARAANMPKDNIERAIKRGTGELAGVTLDNITYDGFGPGGAALIVETLTDNRNRTAQAIKTLFAKHGGNLGAPGSVSWMFEQRGVAHIKKIEPWNEEQQLKLIELGVEDIVDEGDEIAVLTKPDELRGLTERIQQEEWIVSEAVVAFWPKTPLDFPTGRDGEQLGTLLEALEDNDDVQNVATNAVL